MKLLQPWIFVIQAILIKTYQCAKPAYQVSVQITNYDANNKIELIYCSGVMLQKRVILTAASCVTGFDPSSILIVREATNALDENYENAVKSVNLHPQYKATTLEHNIAILRLSASLPLGQDEDFKWIVLGNNDPRNKFCLVHLNEENSSLGSSDIVKWKFGQPAECLSGSQAANEQCRDFNLVQFNCGDNKALTHVNMARGAGIVCESKLYALVTRLQPLKEETPTECLYTKAQAHFTIISSYLEWIYEYIIEEETIDIVEGTYVASKPYQEEMSAPIVELPVVLPSEVSTSVPTTTPEIPTTPATTPETTTTTINTSPKLMTSTVTAMPARLEHTTPDEGSSTAASTSNKRAASTEMPETTIITTADSEFLTRNCCGNVKDISLFYLLLNILTFVVIKYF